MSSTTSKEAIVASSGVLSSLDRSTGVVACSSAGSVKAGTSLIGKRYGRYLVLSYSHKQGRYTYWQVRCEECGEVKTLCRTHLRQGITNQCWTKYSEDRKPDPLTIAKRKHQKKANRRYNLTRTSWQSMRRRCLNPQNANYRNYGGRGITICERWDCYANFLADMGERPCGMMLERIDNNGNYEPSNCRWATPKEQTRNRRVTKYLTFGGETLTPTAWGERFGLSEKTIQYRAKRGIPLDAPINTKKQQARRNFAAPRKERHDPRKVDPASPDTSAGGVHLR